MIAIGRFLKLQFGSKCVTGKDNSPEPIFAANSSRPTLPAEVIASSHSCDVILIL
jgi:hypothetical protein